jgi:organic hydroperoxide reductase OsmC/OhrA
MPDREHRYDALVTWEGNLGDGTSAYERYGRRHRIRIPGKPDLAGSADVAFRGEADRHNPEDLFLAAISACHLLTYLALCARRRIRVIAYEDAVMGTMREDARGGGRFEEVVLRPRVTVGSASDVEAATRLHDRAHELCYIAASCRVPIRHEATVRAAEAVGA